MTRVNLIDPSLLSYAHLLAEYREITRIFGLACAAGDRGQWEAPSHYTMGKGHVKFFFDKLEWVAKRHNALRWELIGRGVSPTIRRPDIPWRERIPAAQWQDWQPTIEEVLINLARLVERNPEHYRGKEADIRRLYLRAHSQDDAH